MSDNQLLRELDVAARKAYDKIVPAYAYVYQHNNENGLRLEAPDILFEYSNGVPLGRDPRGLLYFHGLSDLDPQLKMRYEVGVQRRTEGGATKEEVLVIDFWAQDDPPTSKPYARFLAAVPVRAWGQTKPGKVNGGGWAALDVLQASAEVKSRGNQPLVTITLKSLKKKFEFDIPPEQAEGSNIATHGVLIARDLSQLTGTGLYVDYTNTRILIFKNQGDKYATAVLSPLELIRDDPLVNKTFQVKNGRFTNT